MWQSSTVAVLILGMGSLLSMLSRRWQIYGVLIGKFSVLKGLCRADKSVELLDPGL